ncbi:MAG: hypothetical protein ABEJ69_02715 [Candidatus Nanohaloarchaea archaeon]
MEEGLVEDIVDADAYIEHADGSTERIEFVDIMDYINQPLDRDYVEKSIKSKKPTMGPSRENDAKEDLMNMGKEYYDWIDQFELKMDIHYGDGQGATTRTLTGEPRTDVDMNSGVFPSIVPLQFGDSEEYLVFREMRPYDREFEKWIVKECEFTGPNGYDWNFADSIGTDEYDPSEDVDTFAYVPEALDFVAVHGYDGLHEQIEGLEGVPHIDTDRWKILDVDESTNRIFGVRPFFDNVWETGLSKNEAKKMGKWRGTNRGIKRVMHDLEDEFFHGYNGDDHFVGFYDNEFPMVVGSEKVFDADEWSRFKDVVHTYAPDSEAWVERLLDLMRDEELRTAQTVNSHGIDYKDLIPNRLRQRDIPDEMKADKILE